MGEATYRATRDIVEYGEATNSTAKGKAGPVPAWPALLLRASAEDELFHEAPLVGRARELELLRRTLERVRRERAPQLLTVVGDPGIGKSRLIVSEFFAGANGVANPLLHLDGHTLPYGERASFHALAEMARAQIGALEASADEIPERLIRAVESALPDADEAHRVASHLRPLLGLASEDALHGDRRTEAFAAWRRWFEALAESHPLALVFEDIHWADDGLLDFVDQLVDWATDVPLLVLATARRPARAAARVGRRQAERRRDVPLPARPGRERRAAGCAAPGSGTADRRGGARAGRAGGDPLYAAEYVRMLADRGLLAETAPGDLGRSRELPLPESVHGIIAARLDAPAACRGEGAPARRGGMSCGEVFWVGALAATTSPPTPRGRGAHASSHAQGVRAT